MATPGAHQHHLRRRSLRHRPVRHLHLPNRRPPPGRSHGPLLLLRRLRREPAPDYHRIPAASLGAPLDGCEGERWLDIRAPRSADTGAPDAGAPDASLRAILLARLDLAVERGCDGVEPDNINAWENESGFPISERDQVEFNRWLASSAHDRGLFIALKNAGALVPQLLDLFDLALNEQCHAFAECDDFRPFGDTGRPILNVEYAGDEPTARALAADICPRAQALGLRTLILPLELDDAFRVACD